MVTIANANKGAPGTVIYSNCLTRCNTAAKKRGLLAPTFKNFRTFAVYYNIILQLILTQ